MVKVLVTGGSGFIAVHIIDLLFQKGYDVVTTVRSESKAEFLKTKFAGKPLETAIVPDISVEGAFDEVVKTPGIVYVLHTASPFHFKTTHANPLPTSNYLDLINPAVTGTTSIIKAIGASAPAVKHVVVTSSFASIMDRKHLDSSTTFTEESWNPDTVEDAKTDIVVAYCASKVLAEKAAWQTVKDLGSPFALTTVCPPIVYGPVAHQLTSFSEINTSNNFMVQLLNGEWKDAIPSEFGSPIWIEVRDVAKAHVLALEKKAAKGQRLFTTAGYYSNQKIAKIVYDNFPEKRHLLPNPEAAGEKSTADLFKFNNEKTKQILGFEWTPLEKTIKDLAQSLIDLESKLNKAS
ncbi:methylglyoxal reductase (NADPH-dependent) gre2 [Ceratocystis pirilliformis]|uniref:Methylglyoxal reductase (NADPH-dependent) gre2 n=1 Tax=Ceratocystis pirilliformis TaxID=259994 RepID=A0ABR3Z6D3_9PEZI